MPLLIALIVPVTLGVLLVIVRADGGCPIPNLYKGLLLGSYPPLFLSLFLYIYEFYWQPHIKFSIQGSLLGLLRGLLPPI